LADIQKLYFRTACCPMSLSPLARKEVWQSSTGAFATSSFQNRCWCHIAMCSIFILLRHYLEPKRIVFGAFLGDQRTLLGIHVDFFRHLLLLPIMKCLWIVPDLLIWVHAIQMLEIVFGVWVYLYRGSIYYSFITFNDVWSFFRASSACFMLACLSWPGSAFWKDKGWWGFGCVGVFMGFIVVKRNLSLGFAGLFSWVCTYITYINTRPPTLIMIDWLIGTQNVLL